MRDGEFHDGTMLGQTLKLTRSAVWKMIKKLERYGVQIKSVKGKGYALCEPTCIAGWSDDAKASAGKKIRINLFETIPSTNDYLKSLRAVKCIQFCITEQADRRRAGWGAPGIHHLAKTFIYPACIHFIKI